jgi:aconitate hydratase
VLAKSFARIHHQNLLNYGILPLEFTDPADFEQLKLGDTLLLTYLRQQLQAANRLEVRLPNKNRTITARHHVSPRMVKVLLAGGLPNWVRAA